MRLRPLQERREPAGRPAADGVLDVLRLTAVAVRWHDQPAGHAVGDFGAIIAPDDVQAKVYARGAARRGPPKSECCLHPRTERRGRRESSETGKPTLPRNASGWWRACHRAGRWPQERRLRNKWRPDVRRERAPNAVLEGEIPEEVRWFASSPK